MKSVKRIIAVALAALLVLAAGILSVSAAGEKLTLTMDNNGTDTRGFTYTIYRVATLNTATGSYNYDDTLDSAVKTAINTPNQTGAAFLNVLNTAADANKKVGTADGTLAMAESASATTVVSKEITTPGIYYARVTAAPSTKTKMSNSVFVWPTFDSDNQIWKYNPSYDPTKPVSATNQNTTYSFDLGQKVDKGTDRVTKYFKGDASEAVVDKSAGQGDIIEFTLEADVVGSSGQKIDKFVIWDKMSKGLTYNNDAKVYYDESSTDVTSQFTVSAESFDATHAAYTTGTGFKDDSKYVGGTYITVSANASTLSNNEFYTHKKVYVQYTATVNNDATIGKNYNPNKDGLTYKNVGGSEQNKDGREVKVYTYNVTVFKIDGSKTTATPLPGATFGLYDKDGKLLADGVSKANGYVDFTAYKNPADKSQGKESNPINLGKGTYTVKEISAPTGYALTTESFDVEITDAFTSDGVFNAKADGVKNYPTKLPETGGAGTMVFTIIGGCLVLLAGAMFVMIMRKRSSK